MGTWDNVLDTISRSKRNVKVIDGCIESGIRECKELSIPEQSLLYNIASNSGGIVVDNWIRILGQETGCGKGIMHFNRNSKLADETDGLFIVANDILGGLFAIDINRFENKNNIWYLAPDTLEWEDLDLQYNEFVSWVLLGNTSLFYETMRWTGWEKDTEKLSMDEGILIYPFLWTKECQIETASKKVVPLDELWGQALFFS